MLDVWQDHEVYNLRRIIHPNFCSNCPSGFRGEDFFIIYNEHQTDDRRGQTPSDDKSSLYSLGQMTTKTLVCGYLDLQSLS